jgi:hypothetical protein
MKGVRIALSAEELVLLNKDKMEYHYNSNKCTRQWQKTTKQGCFEANNSSQ